MEDTQIKLTVDNIIKDIQFEKDMVDDPGGYLDEEYYTRCKAKSDAYEEAILIIKKHFPTFVK